MMEGKRFNVRVYGICIYEGKVLVADELIKGKQITKFPGGGLEFGEGTLDCIKREFIEETGQEVRVIRHFYTTDFFVASAFHPDNQVISIYYLVEFLAAPAFKENEKRVDTGTSVHSSFMLRWIALSTISEEEFTFPIDKKVAAMLKQRPPLF